MPISNGKIKRDAKLLRSAHRIRDQKLVNERTDYLIDQIPTYQNRAYIKQKSKKNYAFNFYRYAVYKTLRSSDCTYSEIGRAFNRSHTTVMRTIKKLDKWVKKHPRNDWAIRTRMLLKRLSRENKIFTERQFKNVIEDINARP